MEEAKKILNAKTETEALDKVLKKLILRRRQTPSFRTGSKAPLSINPEQTPGFRPGKVEGLIQEVRERLRPKKPTKRIIDHQSSFGEIQEDSTPWVELARKKKTLCYDRSA